MQHDQTLIFVYNADSKVRNLVLDAARKALRPKSYNCNLCSLTYGLFFENRKWKAFKQCLQEKGYVLEFLHKNEFAKTYTSKFGHKFEFPIILYAGASGFEVLMDSYTLNTMETSEALIGKLHQLLNLS
jgi:hypothetical protein